MLTKTSCNRERIEQMVLNIRGHRVMLDADLARLYGVTTKRLNEQVKRNNNRFPENVFMFRLTQEETTELVANCDRFKKLKHSSSLPRAFTEHGAVMLANVLNSEVAVEASIQIVKAFIRLQKYIAEYSDLAHKINVMEKKYDSQFKVVFDAIRQMMLPPKTKDKSIGFELKKK